MKIGGADAEIAWVDFGPSPNSADSLDDTEIEGGWYLEQTDGGTYVSAGYHVSRCVCSKIIVPLDSVIKKISLLISLVDDPDLIFAKLWLDESGVPADTVDPAWTSPGPPLYGPFPKAWYTWDLDFAVTTGPIWVGALYRSNTGGNTAKIYMKGSGGTGTWQAIYGGSWSFYSGSELAYKVQTDPPTQLQIELAGTPGDYVETGKFTSGAVDLGDEVQLSSVKWTSQEPSPTAIDTVPPPPKTISVRASNVVPTIKKGGGAWADKDVPDIADPEWGGTATYDLLATISVGDAPRGVACDEAVGKTFVVNRTSDTVSVISTASNSVVATIGVGTNPEGVACDETAVKAFVVNSGSSSVSVIHAASNTISATISVGSNPQAVACDETAGKTFVAASGVAPLTVYPTGDSWTDTLNPGGNYGGDPELDVANNTHLSRQKNAFIRFPVGEGITSAVLRIYANGVGIGSHLISIGRVLADWEEYTITWNNQPAVAGYTSFWVNTAGWYEINLTSLAQGWSEGTYLNYGIRLSTGPPLQYDRWAEFDARNAGNPPELVLMYLPKVSVIHTASNTISATIFVGTTASGVACDETAGKTFVSNSGDDSVSVIHTPSNSISATISVGSNPRGVACDETVEKTFVANYDDNTVSVIHTPSNTVSATVNVGSNPRDVVCDEGVGKTFVTNSGNDCVSVVDSSSNLVVGTISIGDGPYGIDCDESAGKIFAANNGDDSVSVISDVEEINYTLPFAEYESGGYAEDSERKRYVQFRATFWGDTT